jgi:photosystem II stability/assembly factor-like uncharacterized protein
MYVGFGSGGLWKTINNGITWHCIFQDQASMGLGDVELAPSNPSIIYLGTGENLKKPRNFTLPGTGMYRSDDAGKSWTHIGLEDSWAISEISIDPKNPNIVLVAVLGHLWSTNKNRGLFKTMNGGKSWQQVLYINDSTGANDIVISPTNPKIMYASMWELYPGIHGKNSRVYRSNDGGNTWKACTKGLPSGDKIGRIGVAVSNSNPLKAYAFVDNLHNPSGESAELYKTTDGGISWNKTHTAPFKLLSVIGWYFMDVFLNPKNDEEVYCLGVRLANSIDGGKTFTNLGGEVIRMNPSAASGFHLDQCDLWINPANPNHLAAGNDGGFYVSYDHGKSWMHYNNIPAGEFYDITIDQKNGLIYGGTQDDATVYGPAKEPDPLHPDQWKYLWIDPWDGGDGCVSMIDPEDDNTVYYSAQHGAISRYDKNADTSVYIQPELPKNIKDTLRFNYITPYFISSYDHLTLYHGGNYIFKSIDRGDHWQVISPNLARTSKPEKKSFSMGFIAESPLQKAWLYAGTDKGAFWISKDDGITWAEKDNGLANNYIRSIHPSRFSASRIYITMTGINYDDLHAYAYVSEDNGDSWSTIISNLPDEPINVLIEDPKFENILYIGTMRGVYISADRGLSWSYLGNHMPGAAIADLEINNKTDELIAATHGRGIYKLSLHALHNMLSRHLSKDSDHLFQIQEVILPWFSSSSNIPDYRTIEKTGFAFWLSNSKQITLTIRDKNNKEVWKTNIQGYSGLNEYRWDMIVLRQDSDLPYFTKYKSYIRSGTYNLVLSDGNEELHQDFMVINRNTPYKE